MHSGKKMSKDDTWRPADLKRHIREDHIRRQEVNERRHQGEESKERRRDPEKEARRERDKQEWQSTTDKRDEDKKEKYVDQRREGTRYRRGDKEMDVRDERDKEKRKDRERVVDDKYSEYFRENRDRKSDRDGKHDRVRDKAKQRYSEEEREKDIEKYSEEDLDKRREERHTERRREERDREHRTERKSHEDSVERGRDRREKYDRDQRDKHRDEYEKKSIEKEKPDRQSDGKHSEWKGQRGHNEAHGKHKDERERRTKERGHHEVKQKADSDSKEHRDAMGTFEEVKHHPGDKERAERDKHKERRHLQDEDPDRKHRERRHRQDEDPLRKHRERSHREEEDAGTKHRERRHREEEDAGIKHRERRHREEEDAGTKHRERRHREEEDAGTKHRERRHREEEDAGTKHRERRHREEEDAGTKHRERRHREEEDAGTKHRERRHREEEDADRKHRERRHREEEEADRKHKERRHKEEEDPERKHKERRHKEEEDAERKQRERKHKEEEVAERKHRERRYKEEEEETERNHRNITNSKKTSSDQSHVSETNVKEAEVVIDEDLGDQEYEDDFEDYEEDFEEMDDSEDEGEIEKEAEQMEKLTPQRKKEIEAIQRAMDEENERVGTAQFRQSTNRAEEEESKRSGASEKNQTGGSQRGTFIDFVAAKQREVSKEVATKQKKRSTELRRLIDLDFSMTFPLFDLPPVNEYDMYIRNFGSANTKQAYVQCNEDNADRDIQTEEIGTCVKWTQHPPERNGACGDANLSQEARDKTISDVKVDSQRLAAFLSSASQVILVLLEEDETERKSLRKLRTQTNTLSFSEGSSQLNTKLPFLYGRHISLLHFSQVQRHTMLSVHAPTTKPSAVRLDSCTIICIWNIWEPSRPQKILVYESEVQCCCFSTGKAILVFAGTPYGSVVLWDLREPASNHYHMKIGEDEWTFRHPTFSTYAVMANSGHLAAVTCVEVVSSGVVGGLRPEVPLLATEEDSAGLSFQLASLDESGVLHFWVVVELPKANKAGSLTDLGLRPGSKVKLLHSSSLLTADAVKPGPLETLHLKFLSTDSNHFFIGTNMGLVIHGTSHGLKAYPKVYRFQEPGARPVDVTSIHFSPFIHNMFLVACGDGSIRLHAVSHEQPVAEWKSSTAGEAVVSLQWAQTRPTVFCVLDAASNLHIWDLLKNEAEPVVTERMAADRVTAMAVFGASGQQNIYSGVALAHESGKIEMHYFTGNFTVSVTAEEEKLESMMTDVF